MIHAAGGNDKVYGNEGDDWLKVGTGQDVLYGDEDNDRAKGHLSGDMVFGGPGDDLLCRERGTARRTNVGARDVIDCGEGTDTGIYTPGVDEITNCKSLNPPSPSSEPSRPLAQKEGLARGGWGERASP